MTDIIWHPHRSLRSQARRVNDFALHKKKFYEYISSMFMLMYYRGGVGLSAPQIGWNARLFVINHTGDRSLHETHGKIFINPSIVGLGGKIVEQEGCLSLPGIYGDVERNESVSIRYATPDRDGVEEIHSGFMARIIQHEYDHLNGVVFIDRLTAESRLDIKEELASHKERVKKIRKKRAKESKETRARKKRRTEKRRKQRKKRKK